MWGLTRAAEERIGENGALPKARQIGKLNQDSSTGQMVKKPLPKTSGRHRGKDA